MIFGIGLLLLASSACRKKEFDAYYGRPDWLAQPIYQQLQARKNFTHLLATIDKAGYKDILSKAGYWTFFAPNDSAFESYFKAAGISGDDAIDSIQARKIVTYSLVYNAYRREQLVNQQTSSGPDTNQAFKRKTAYYDWVYSENGRLLIAANRNGGYAPNDNNNKNISYFIDKFLSQNGLNASDYNYFYPTTPFSGFNVVDATVTEADIPAENGIIHVIDKVVTPLDNLERYLATNPEYSEFRNLLDKLVTYQSNADITHRNLVLTGNPDSVFVKVYSAALAFSPNNENYIQSGTDAQKSGWTLVVPTNDILIPYEKMILEHYKTFEAAPPTVLSSLLNAHMFQTAVWPNKLRQTTNSQQEVPTFSQGDIVDKKVCSNGFFYGIRSIQDANVFRTIYGKAFLDPDYSLMTKLLDADLKYSIINPSVKYTMFMMPDNLLRAAGYDWSSERNDWSYLPAGGTITYGPGASDRLNRMLQTSVLLTNNGEMDNLSGEGIIESWNGEYIKYKDNTVWAAGNADNGNVLHVNSVKTAYNGQVLYVDGLLQFTEKTIGAHLETLATNDPNGFDNFFQYLKNSSLWNAATKDIIGTVPGTFYTVFVPVNSTIIQAVRDGVLPGDVATGTPNFTPTTNEDKDKVTSFIQFHIINRNTIVPDGKKEGAFETLLKTDEGETVFMFVKNNTPNQMEVWDSFNNVAQPDYSRSNNLSARTVIHAISHYLRGK